MGSRARAASLRGINKEHLHSLQIIVMLICFKNDESHDFSKWFSIDIFNNLLMSYQRYDTMLTNTTRRYCVSAVCICVNISFEQQQLWFLVSAQRPQCEQMNHAVAFRQLRPHSQKNKKTKQTLNDSLTWERERNKRVRFENCWSFTRVFTMTRIIFPFQASAFLSSDWLTRWLSALVLFDEWISQTSLSYK